MNRRRPEPDETPLPAGRYKHVDTQL